MNSKRTDISDWLSITGFLLLALDPSPGHRLTMLKSKDRRSSFLQKLGERHSSPPTGRHDRSASCELLSTEHS